MTQFRPLRAATVEAADLPHLRYPTLGGSPKFDGIRSVLREGEMLSRRLKLIPNRELRSFFTTGLALDDIESELICGDPCAPDVYQRTQSAVMSHESEDAKNVKLYIFDFHGTGFDVPYFRRMEHLTEMLKYLPRRIRSRLVVVEQTLLPSQYELEKFERDSVAQGYEGIMLRDLTAPYKFGDSTLREGYLLKYKRFLDGEARILGTYEQEENTNEATKNELGFTKRSSAKAGMVKTGRLGGMHVIDIKSGVEFDIGTGWTLQQRIDLWAIRKQLVEKVAKYRYQSVGVKERPRFPRFLGFRDPIDIV